MNTKFLYALLGLLAASSATASLEAASTDGSLPVEIAAVPECKPQEQSTAGFILTNNDRKKMCQTQLNIKELLTIPASDQTTLKAMCDNVSCMAALKALYQVLPNCRYLDWPFKLSVEDRLRYCGIDPATLAGSSSGADDAGSLDGSVANTTTTPPANWTTSSSDGDFAPIGVTPSPEPETSAPAATVPTPTATSASSTVFVSTATAAMVVAAAVAVL